MGLDAAQTQLADVMHVVSQALLIPVIVLLIALIGYALFTIGSILAEAFGERKNFRAETPKFLKSLTDAPVGEMPETITGSGLLNRQKLALLTVYDYRALPGDALVALIRRLVSAEEAHYKKIVDRNNIAAKISPMVGLMGTLIPLGPGVAALGQGDTTTLSNSLLIAFDTTVAGLIVAAICLAIGKIRSNWYDDYMSALDSSMATMLQKIQDLRAAGGLESTEPDSTAEQFRKRISKNKATAAPRSPAKTPNQPQTGRAEANLYSSSEAANQSQAESAGAAPHSPAEAASPSEQAPETEAAHV